jgi:hypothetical protein
MSILPGFEDLKARDVLAFNSDGTVTVVVGDKVERYQMCVNPTGSFSAHAIPARKPDQVEEPKRVPVALRWANTDQGAAAMQRGEM